MPTFRQILVPFDGSDHSIWSLQNAIEIGKPNDAQIIVFHAIQHYFHTVKPATYIPFLGMLNATTMVPMGQEPLALDRDAEERLFQSQKEIGTRLLAEAKKRVEAAGLKCETLLVENKGPVEAARELVEKRGIDLVIVGARGVHNAVERLLLGSVSSGIVNSACTNIMIMRSECAASHGAVQAEPPKKQKAKGKS
ncbi:MAG: universal stress protein [Candidatus Lokiarchaeota archaeon]|nr:universal stress protein [Candidatus Lokiarchaeota archaeon]